MIPQGFDFVVREVMAGGNEKGSVLLEIHHDASVLLGTTRGESLVGTEAGTLQDTLSTRFYGVNRDRMTDGIMLAIMPGSLGRVVGRSVVL